MWYIIKDDKIIVAPKNKKLQNGATVINFDKNKKMLQQYGYKEYTGTKSVLQLKIIDGQVVEKSEQQMAAQIKAKSDALFNNYYKLNSDLATCVRQYKELLDRLKLSYQAKTYDISAAITASTLSDIEKINLGFTATTLWNNIVLNIQSLNIKNPMSYAWENMSKLIEYLPVQTVTTETVENTENVEATVTTENIEQTKNIDNPETTQLTE